MSLETLTIERRFCGPSHSGNGGYTCGKIARHIKGVASVRLLVPPPLNTPLSMEAEKGTIRLMHGEKPVGEGRSASLEMEVPEPFTFDEALEASRAYEGFLFHSFPRCFVCGPLREERDGLRIFAGRRKEGEPVAAPWTVDASLAEQGEVGSEFIWAALDCPGAFAVSRYKKGVAIVLGELTAKIERKVKPGDKCVAMGWAIDAEGRKRIAGSAIFTETGELVGKARATWVEIPEDLFPPEK